MIVRTEVSAHCELLCALPLGHCTLECGGMVLCFYLSEQMCVFSGGQESSPLVRKQTLVGLGGDVHWCTPCSPSASLQLPLVV